MLDLIENVSKSPEPGQQALEEGWKRRYELLICSSLSFAPLSASRLAWLVVRNNAVLVQVRIARHLQNDTRQLVFIYKHYLVIHVSRVLNPN